jgi:hypothetical protein
MGGGPPASKRNAEKTFAKNTEQALQWLPCVPSARPGQNRIEPLRGTLFADNEDSDAFAVGMDRGFFARERDASFRLLQLTKEIS